MSCAFVPVNPLFSATDLTVCAHLSHIGRCFSSSLCMLAFFFSTIPRGSGCSGWVEPLTICPISSSMEPRWRRRFSCRFIVHTRLLRAVDSFLVQVHSIRSEPSPFLSFVSIITWFSQFIAGDASLFLGPILCWCTEAEHDLCMYELLPKCRSIATIIFSIAQ